MSFLFHFSLFLHSLFAPCVSPLSPLLRPGEVRGSSIPAAQVCGCFGVAIIVGGGVGDVRPMVGWSRRALDDGRCLWSMGGRLPSWCPASRAARLVLEVAVWFFGRLLVVFMVAAGGS
ncbi:hypothetical protein Dimus_018179 [Dionaea muscipula]